MLSSGTVGVLAGARSLNLRRGVQSGALYRCAIGDPLAEASTAPSDASILAWPAELALPASL